jgi:hypothetical protein
MYFIGKFQQKQKQLKIIGTIGQDLFQDSFNIRAEISLITISIALFISLLYFPQYATTGIAIWFRKIIIDLETTVLIGFIFKIIGFFFLLGMILKMMNGIIYILSGKPFLDIKASIKTEKDKGKSGDFDHYEEVD